MATSSDPDRFRAGALLAALLILLSATAPVAARVLLGVDEALGLVYPGAEIERRTLYLSAEERARAEALAGGPLASGVARPYVAHAGGELVGTAYLDTHRVRTLPQTVMVALDAAGRVLRVEVLSFDEPPDYLPRGEWYRQFEGRDGDAPLAPGRDVRGVTGATLTTRTTAAAVKRVLALHAVITAREEGAP
ncbi:MAG TPA: FMN-binding protein [Thermoanaerobaculia bacterium]|mgnify:FL=1|nr:FMN-binding protein [Thermoanaerobaculia bacterium]